MKLLGWMHRKLRQNNNDVFKEFATSGGGTSNSITTGVASPDPVAFLASVNDYFADDAFEINHPSSLPDTSTDLFTFGGSSLLTIGTLGTAAVAVPGKDDDYCDVDVVDANNTTDATTEAEQHDVDGAVTPTFTYPPPPDEEAAVEKAVEAIAEKDDDTTTEDDLMVVNAELEKVLGGRNSGATGDVVVASARTSFATGAVDCPLQGFLFGSPVSDAESRQERRESMGGGRRTSLGELFLRTRFAADDKVALVTVQECEDGEDGKAWKGRGRGKVTKGKVKDDKSAGVDGAPTSATTKSKFQKILQMFHKKVYPETTALGRSLTKKGRRKRGGTDDDEPRASTTKLQRHLPAGFGCCCANRSSFGGCASPGGVDDDKYNGSKSAHWIRTDGDYLVLEF